MAMSKKEIQERSDKKRGVKKVGIQLPLKSVALLSELVEKTGRSRTSILIEAIDLFAKQHPFV